MKKLLIAVAFLTGCVGQANTPDDKPTPEELADQVRAASEDLTTLAPPGFDMEAWLGKINPRTCGRPPVCQILVPGECAQTPQPCGITCLRVPGGQEFVGVCGDIEQ
jgi:hypothetical protein